MKVPAISAVSMSAEGLMIIEIMEAGGPYGAALKSRYSLFSKVGQFVATYQCSHQRRGEREWTVTTKFEPLTR
jgi:hypothetical protein